MLFNWRKVLIVGGLSLIIVGVGQAQEIGTFEDGDSSNDPNACYAAADPDNCDWTRGWYQAAVNTGHISLQDAQAIYPDMQVTDYVPAGAQAQAQATLDEWKALAEDDDPTNDPNMCYTSTDPNCDWVLGWHVARNVTYSPPGQASQNVLIILLGNDPTWLAIKEKELANYTPAPGVYKVVFGLCPPNALSC